jgi:hypothetical protein
MQIQLGDRVKDKVTGYTGIVVARTEWLNGCVRITVQNEKLKDGQVQPDFTFDEFQLTLLKGKVVTSGGRETGGPIPSPRQHGSPSR